MKKALLLGLIVIAAVLIARVGLGISVSLRAERTYQAGLSVSLVLIEFVETNQRWPESWEELESMELEPQGMYAWPDDADEVKACVTVRFDMNLAEVAESPESTIEPIGPYYDGYDRFLVHAMQTRRKDSDGSQGNQ